MSESKSRSDDEEELKRLRAMFAAATEIQGDEEVLKYVTSGNAIPVTRCTVSADLIRQLVASRSERGRWIPVSERIPEEWPFVVRWNDEVAKHVCDRYEVIDHDPDWPSPATCIDWNAATDWMPLPAERSDSSR